MERISWVFVGEMRLLGECRGRRKRKSMNGRGRVVHTIKWVELPFSFLFFVVYCTLLSKYMLHIVGADNCHLQSK